jgi:hypothetical protein
MAIGAGIAILAALIWIISYNHAASSANGGHYFAWWGGIVLGGLWFVRGLAGWRKFR